MAALIQAAAVVPVFEPVIPIAPAAPTAPAAPAAQLQAAVSPSSTGSTRAPATGQEIILPGTYCGLPMRRKFSQEFNLPIWILSTLKCVKIKFFSYTLILAIFLLMGNCQPSVQIA